jgi:hypothetical protein
MIWIALVLFFILVWLNVQREEEHEEVDPICGEYSYSINVYVPDDD